MHTEMGVNRRYWEEAVEIHMRSAFYDVDGFRAGRCTLDPIVKSEVGDVSGKELLHLQCHFGMDSLSLARRGAVVTGLDYSAAAVAAARKLSDEIDVPARFVESNVYDARSVIDGRFDLVFTSWGVLGWLPDLDEWARIIAHFLKPGGRFVIVEAHPAVHWFDDGPNAAKKPLTAVYPYRGDGQPELYDEPGTYSDGGEDMVNTKEYFWRHGLGDIVSAIAAAGLRIDRLREHPVLVWPGLPALVQGDDGYWRTGPEQPDLPLSFSLSAYR